MNLTPTFASLAVHCLIQSKTGELWGWGSNGHGAVGIGYTSNDHVTATKVLLSSEISKKLAEVASGWNHVVARTRDGEVFVWGSAYQGQLGNGENEDRTSPLQISMPNKLPVTKISAGADFSVAITNDGKLWGWGDNGDGQLAANDPLKRNSNVPIQAPVPGHVVYVSCGRDHVWAKTADGKWYSWGYNGSGQLGRGSISGVEVGLTKFQDFETIVCGGYHTLGIKEDRTVWGIGRTCPSINGEFAEIPRVRDVVTVAAGLSHSLVLTKKGRVFAWGNNTYGQVGAGGESSENPVKLPIEVPVAGIFCGAYYSGAVDVHGSVYLWGMRTLPELDSPPTPKKFEGFQAWVPRTSEKDWTEMYRWLFLGRSCPESQFSVFPVEILFCAVSIFYE
jgi:alpha-tubulin suppressor-like RCC1 family protein